MTDTSIAVVILAGGRASRMGGGDKPLRLLKGRPILDHVLATIPTDIRARALNANGDPSRFEAYDLPVLPDATADFPGPLAGILAGLDWAADLQGITTLLSLPGDCPFLPLDLVEKLEAARSEAKLPLACAASGGWTHPVIGLWPLALRDELRAALAAGERKIDRFTARFGCAHAQWPLEPIDPFFNVNTPEELAQAELNCLLVERACTP